MSALLVPAKILVAEYPVVYTVDDLLTGEECQAIIDRAGPLMKDAGVSTMPGQTGFKTGEYRGRTNRSHWIEIEEFPTICQRIADIMDCNVDHFESMQVIHYGVGQEYKYHFDAYDRENKDRYKHFCSERGNRLKTALIYLNDVAEGGETGFNMLKPMGEVVKVAPKKGRAVIFHNVNRDGSLNKCSRHAGLPVLRGEKWAFNLWLREV